MINKIFGSQIKINILKTLLRFEELKNQSVKMTAGRLQKVAKLRRIPSEDLDFLSEIGFIDSSKRGLFRYISLTEKGRKSAKIINEIENLLQ